MAVDSYLHSTMYLLNHLSQNTAGDLLSDLHSTMYLLNPSAAAKITITDSLFTFHYVSIKSSKLDVWEYTDVYLHSTMYLLNQR